MKITYAFAAWLALCTAADAQVDTSMYRVPQNNLLDQFGQIHGFANAVEQNKILQLEQQRRNIEISQQQTDLRNLQLGLVGQELTSVYVMKNFHRTRKHVQDAVSNLIESNPGVFGEGFAAQVLSDLPSDAAVKVNRQAIDQWLIANAMMTERGRQAIQWALQNATALQHATQAATGQPNKQR